MLHEDISHKDEELPMISSSNTSSLRRRKKDAKCRTSLKHNPLLRDTESQQYDQEESEVWWHHQLQR
jgi:hypothetical protein